MKTCAIAKKTRQVLPARARSVKGRLSPLLRIGYAAGAALPVHRSRTEPVAPLLAHQVQQNLSQDSTKIIDL
jgi:hypothetical protein